MTDAELKYIQLERKMQFWRTRCRELKNYLRRIGDVAIAQGSQEVERLVRDALNGVGRDNYV